MKRIVVDASVVVAGLFKDGSVRDALLRASGVNFAAPAYLREEAGRHLEEVAVRARLPSETVGVVLEDLLSVIELVPPGVYSSALPGARQRSRSAGAPGDADYVALATALDAPVWTLDKDFSRIPGIRVLSTREIQSLV